MGGAWAHYAYARHACVMGVRGDRGKIPQKKGVRGRGQISHKRRLSTKKEDQKKFKKFFFFLLTPTSP